jgi:hypothetical protein
MPQAPNQARRVGPKLVFSRTSFRQIATIRVTAVSLAAIRVTATRDQVGERLSQRLAN